MEEMTVKNEVMTTTDKVLTTKEKIIFESLKLFSQKGYDGVSMREIAAAVGIKGASIYNHFSGKEEIFKAIFNEMEKRYQKSAASMNIPVAQDDETVNLYINIDEKSLFSLVENLLSFFCKDDFAAMFRRLLTCEQYKSKEAAEFFKQYYFDAPVQYQMGLFMGMQEHGIMQSFSPETLALHFYSPIYFTLCQYDLGYSYDECLEQLKKHVLNFCTLYVKK